MGYREISCLHLKLISISSADPTRNIRHGKRLIYNSGPGICHGPRAKDSQDLARHWNISADLMLPERSTGLLKALLSPMMKGIATMRF